VGVTAVSSEASAAARRAARSTWLERLTRFGLLGYGVTHLLVGWIALQLAFGKAPAAGDQSGAFQTLVKQPSGKFLLIAVAIGLAAMTIWQALEAAVGHLEERGRARVFERVASAGKAAFYAFLAYKAFQVVMGSTQSSSAQQQQTTGNLLASPGGRWLVGLIGLAIVAVGIGLIWYGWTKRFERYMKKSEMSPSTRKTARWLGMLGYAAKGIAYGTLGLLVLTAAATYDASKAGGLDGALHTLAQQPYGDLILIGVALGIAAYGVFCLFQARYRKV
jgi:uncharacterized protein DUF1206